MRVLIQVAALAILAAPLAGQTQRTSSFGKSRIEVFADGNLKNALGQGDGQLAAASLGLGISMKRLSLSLLVNTIGTAKPLEKDFGTTLLAPASGASLAAGLVDVRWLTGKDTVATTFKRGWRFYGSISSAEWQVLPGDPLPTGVVVGGFGFGRFYSLLGEVKSDEDPNPVGAVFDIGVAARAIGGDIASDFNEDRLNAAIPGGGKVHIGLELGLQLQINGAKASLTYYAFWGKDVPGLTRGQVVAGFSVQSPLFKGEFAPRNDKAKRAGTGAN